MTPEGKVKKKVTALLQKYGAYYMMPVTGGWGQSALDYLGIHRGYGFSIETKRMGKEPTDRQKQITASVQRAGGVVFKINSEDDLKDLERWLVHTPEAHAETPTSTPTA